MFHVSDNKDVSGHLLFSCIFMCVTTLIRELVGRFIRIFLSGELLGQIINDKVLRLSWITFWAKAAHYKIMASELHFLSKVL